MKSILFLHGFFASGSCVPANALKEAFEGEIRVLTPDLPIHPKEALELIHKICDKENPDLIVGNSCGSFYAQMIAPLVGIPALLGNPYFVMTEFLKERVGDHQYKSPRVDGKQDFTIDNELIKEFEEVESTQFNCTTPYFKDKIWGIFGENDTLAHFEPLFLEHYENSFHFPGAHTPTAEEVKAWHVPLIRKMLASFPKKQERFFQHFKGGKYKFIRTAFDSETQERMVVYQALYGDCNFWVRSEKMFFEKVTKEGKTFNRFTEFDRLTMHVVRHGQTKENVIRMLQGHMPGNLTDLGKEQVSKTAEELANSGVKFKCIVASDLKRTMDSAQIIAEKLNLPVVPMKTLRERDWGSYTGTPLDEAREKYYKNGKWHFPLTDNPAETEEEILQRARKATEDLLNQYDGDIIVVTHGQFARNMFATHFNCSYKEIESFTNAEVRILRK